MNAARILIADAEREGAFFRVEGGKLRLVPSPGDTLPPALVERAKALRSEVLAALSDATDNLSFASASTRSLAIETWEERAAHLEYDAGMPRDWAEHFARILCGPVPGDFSPTRWQGALDGALRFADLWAKEAHRLGWDASEVFGLHPSAPAARVDQRGLAWLLGDGSEVIAIDCDGADIQIPRGGRQRFYRVFFHGIGTPLRG